MHDRYLEIVRSCAWKGYPKWGFVIYRGVYGNDAEWATFIKLWKALLTRELREQGFEDEIGSNHEWTIIEDQTALEGVSKDAVRAHFADWVARRSLERDGEGYHLNDTIERVARFKYCIYIDEACLNSVTAQQQPGGQSTRLWSLCGGEIAIISRAYVQPDPDQVAREYHDNFEPDTDELTLEEYLAIGPEQYGAIGGNTNFDVGWAYTGVLGSTELYCYLCSGDEHWGDLIRLHRPENPPDWRRKYGQPLSAVPFDGPFDFLRSTVPLSDADEDTFSPASPCDGIGLSSLAEE